MLLPSKDDEPLLIVGDASCEVDRVLLSAVVDESVEAICWWASREGAGKVPDEVDCESEGEVWGLLDAAGELEEGDKY